MGNPSTRVKYDRSRVVWLTNGDAEWPATAYFLGEKFLAFGDEIGRNCPNGFEFRMHRDWHEGLDATHWRYIIWDKTDPFGGMVWKGFFAKGYDAHEAVRELIQKASDRMEQCP